MNHITTTSSRRSISPITFIDADFTGVDPEQDDPIVITVGIINWDVRKVLIDEGSSTGLLFLSTFQRLDISPKVMKPHPKPLFGFAGGQVHTHGAVELKTTFGMGDLSRTLLVQYILIDTDTSYNVLIG